MFEKFTSVDSADFKQRYLGTYGFFRSSEKRTLVQIKGIAANKVTFIDRNKLDYFLQADSTADVGFEFVPPKSSYYNIKGGECVLISRIPSRQYLRGVCHRNTSIKGLNSGPMSIDFETLASVFESEETVQSALTASLASGQGFAISPQFAISLMMQQLYCFDTPIGSVKVNPTTRVFEVDLLQPDLWGVEVRDAFQRNGLSLEMV